MNETIGKNRKFSFLNGLYTIIEIIENPQFEMEWSWSRGVCPHCKKEISEKKIHRFKSIELLMPQSKTSLSILQQKPYVVGYGDDTEGKRMFIPREKARELLSQSKYFKI